MLSPAEVAEADIFFAKRCVNVLVTAPVSQQEVDVLVEIAVDFGCDVMATSMLLVLLNKGDVEGAAAEYINWKRILRKKADEQQR